MPFPETCEGALDAIHDSSIRGSAYALYAMNHLNDAKSHWNLNQDHAAIYDLWLAGLDIRVAAEYNAYNYSPFYPGGPWEWYLRNCITMPELTWKDIVEAWIKDDFAGRAPTIAVIDRMRQILWDEPFSVLWAARPEHQIP